MFIKNTNAGHLTVIYGPMFSEKSGALIHHLSLAQTYQNKKAIVFKPLSDVRSSNEVVSRLGTRMVATEVKDFSDISTLSNALNYDIIGIDEAQLFNESILKFVKLLLREKKHVVVAGLSLDYKGNPFGHMAELIVEADECIQCFACCSVCGQPASFTQRVIDGRVVTDGDVVLIGDKESYEPRCREHFERSI